MDDFRADDDDGPGNSISDTVSYMLRHKEFVACPKCGFCCVIGDNPCPKCERIAEWDQHQREHLVAMKIADLNGLDARTGLHFWPLSEQEPTEPPSDTCPTCKGAGAITEFYWRVHGLIRPGWTAPCPDCNGAGVAP